MPDESLFGRLLCNSAEPESPALSHDGRVWSYRELAETIRATAGALKRRGVTKGDRVAIVFPNSPELVIAFFATVALGAVAVTVSPRAGRKRLSLIVSDTDPLIGLCGDSVPAGMGELFVPLRLHEEGLAALGEEDPRGDGLELPLVAPDELGLILFSSGSTGRPKGVPLRHSHLLAIAETLHGVVGMKPEHRDLILAPMTHSGGWQRVTATFLAGGCAIIYSGLLCVPGLLEEVRQGEVDAFFSPPPLLRALLRSSKAKVREALTGVRSIETASAPLSPKELQGLLELLPDCRILFQYGLTECSRAVILDARAHPSKLHTVGTATRSVQIKIAGDAGQSLGPDEEGEIWLKAVQRADGYWRRPELDRQRFRDGWLLTGDYGSLDGDGFLRLLGRRDDMINCGGSSFFPAEVEGALGAVAGLREYLVAGVRDPQNMLHQVPWAFVVPEEPDHWSARDFLSLCRRELPPHMVPRRAVVLPSMPVTGSRKPSRKRVIELYGPKGERGIS